ncbi:hypothetical protein BKA65DRAFT_473766 [Rhexocercosporidium sp. MPI-PUGE-AT-0058]|nr:hypothetical protein BKA65DRAFT_473766 [Rhexocercosporidium sp. MPI-PUGE-AT-0058]
MSQKQSSALASAFTSKSDYTNTARTFTEPVTQAVISGASEEELEEKLSVSWGVLIDLAAKTEHEAQEPLVETVKAIQTLGSSSGKESKTVTIWDSQVKLWGDMPLLGASMRSAWNRAPGSSSKDDFSATEWVNLNAFVARLTALSLSIPAFDFSLYAIWTMRSAFEGSESDDAAVGAAKMWFLYAGEFIEKLSREGKAFDGRIARGGENYGEKGWKGFCEERLEVWKAA